MKSALRNGLLVSPHSMREGLARYRQLLHEITKVETQLADPNRVLRYERVALYDEWKDKARHALKLFKSEERQLTEWITRHETLLLESWDLLGKLADEVDLEPEETALMKKLDKHFGQGRVHETLRATSH